MYWVAENNEVKTETHPKRYTYLLGKNETVKTAVNQFEWLFNQINSREILKDEFYLDQTFDSLQHAKRATKNAINLYNEIRLHLSLDYKTPNMVYLKTA
ncbi:integrase core domain-containing protein [Autumnicola edwardsiae]|uniref:integrase core domain-containing protein n=1 Tax=Autumnicola edwardsiae TaxID=3075594 RepID=UPI003D780B14